MTGLPEGTSIGEFVSPTWAQEYRRRVAGVMDIVNRAGGIVVWIGLPITRSEAQTQRFDIVNAIVQKEAKARPGKAIFIDTYTMFAGDNGGFAEYLENAKGDTVKVRAGDGVHFDTGRRRHDRARGAEAAERDVRPDELAQTRRPRDVGSQIAPTPAGCGGTRLTAHCREMSRQRADHPGHPRQMIDPTDVTQALSDALGAEHVRDGDSERDLHARNLSFHAPHRPDLVVYPGSTDEVALVLAIANEHRIPVTPFGVGTSLEGHVIPVRGGISLDLSRLDRILEISPENLTATVQAGVTRLTLERAAGEHGLFFPVDPGADATLGGMAATNAAGHDDGALREDARQRRSRSRRSSPTAA